MYNSNGGQFGTIYQNLAAGMENKAPYVLMWRELQDILFNLKNKYQTMVKDSVYGILRFTYVEIKTYVCI